MLVQIVSPALSAPHLVSLRAKVITVSLIESVDRDDLKLTSSAQDHLRLYIFTT